MKKADIFAAAMGLCETHKAPKALVDGLTDLLKPKTAGQSVNLDEVTKKDGNGNITHVMCSVSGHFLPATVEFFYEETKEGKGIKGTDGKMLRRLSRQAESIRKKFTGEFNASKQAILEDVLKGEKAGGISAEAGQKKVEALAGKVPDYSKMAKTSAELASQKAAASKAAEAEASSK